MSNYFKLSVCVLSLLILPQYSKACNGYVLKFHYLQHCPDVKDNVVTFKDITCTLDANCNIIPHADITIKSFKTAMMHYRAEKRPLPAIEGDVDLCKALQDKNEHALLATTALGVPQSCPVDAQHVIANGNKKANISKYKGKLGIALGVSIVNLTVTHDTGITCLNFKVEFLKPRRRG